MKVAVSYEFAGSTEVLDQAVAEIVAEYDRRNVADPALTAVQDQEVARMLAGITGAGVDFNDPGQRNAFLVGALGGWASASENVAAVCRQAAYDLHFMDSPFGYAMLRLARRA